MDAGKKKIALASGPRRNNIWCTSDMVMDGGNVNWAGLPRSLVGFTIGISAFSVLCSLAWEMWCDVSERQRKSLGLAPFRKRKHPVTVIYFLTNSLSLNFHRSLYFPPFPAPALNSTMPRVNTHIPISLPFPLVNVSLFRTCMWTAIRLYLSAWNTRCGTLISDNTADEMFLFRGKRSRISTKSEREGIPWPYFPFLFAALFFWPYPIPPTSVPQKASFFVPVFLRLLHSKQGR